MGLLDEGTSFRPRKLLDSGSVCLKQDHLDLKLSEFFEAFLCELLSLSESQASLKHSVSLKKIMGRRKIPIEKIENRVARNVAFSKRRTGIFKKATELCKLCGAAVAMIVKSPGNKPYIFGYPDAQTVFDHFLSSDAGDTGSGLSASVERLNPDASGTQREKEVGFWWDAPIQNMGTEELEVYLNSLQDLSRKMRQREGQIEPAISVGFDNQDLDLDLDLDFEFDEKTLGFSFNDLDFGVGL